MGSALLDVTVRAVTVKSASPPTDVWAVMIVWRIGRKIF